jgi:S-adenosylmethionine decarboxylase proenzyme
MSEKTKEFGKHYLVEFIDCVPDKIKYIREVKRSFLQAAERSQAEIVDHHFHQFSPYGVSGIILIAWSHFAVHTWPEDGYAAFDIFTCGEMYPELAIEELEKSFEAKRVDVQILSRGF